MFNSKTQVPQEETLSSSGEQIVENILNEMLANNGNGRSWLVGQVRKILENNDAHADYLLVGTDGLTFDIEIFRLSQSDVDAIIEGIEALINQIVDVQESLTSKSRKTVKQRLAHRWAEVPLLHQMPGLDTLKDIAGSAVGNEVMFELVDIFAEYHQLLISGLNDLNVINRRGSVLRQKFITENKLRDDIARLEAQLNPSSALTHNVDEPLP